MEVLKQKTARVIGRFVFCVRLFLLRLRNGCRGSRGLLHESVQTGLLAGSGVLLDDLLLGCLVDGLLGFLVELLGVIELAGGHRFTGLLDGALHDTFGDLVLGGLGDGDAHVLPGVFLDWHSGFLVGSGLDTVWRPC